MAIVHMDDFGIYGTDEALMEQGVYGDILYADLATDPVDGVSPCMLIEANGTGTGYIRWIYPGAVQSSLGLAGRYYFPSLPTQSDTIPFLFKLTDGSNNAILTVTVTTTGRLQIRDGGSAGTVLATSTAPVIVTRSWQHLEFKATNVEISAGGAVEIRSEGVTVLSLSGASFGTAQIAGLEVGTDPDNTGAQRSFYFKDMVVWDTNGTSNTDFLGSVIVTPITIESDDSLNWTVVGGITGREVLTNIPPVTGEYIQAVNPPPAAYVANLTALPDDVTSVKAVMTYVRAQKVDGGDASLQVSMISGASTGNGANRPITTAPIYWTDIFSVDPATSAAWSVSAVNAAKLKINRTI